MSVVVAEAVMSCFVHLRVGGRVGMGVGGALEVVEVEAAYAAVAAATMAASCLCFALLSCTSDLAFKNLRKS